MLENTMTHRQPQIDKAIDKLIDEVFDFQEKNYDKSSQYKKGYCK